MGALRWILLAVWLLVMVLRPAPGTPLEVEGWALVRTGIMPVLALMVLITLLLDTLMAWIYSLDAEVPEVRRLRRVIAVHAGAALLLILYWLPYFLALLP
jgi:hypothetical protein